MARQPGSGQEALSGLERYLETAARRRLGLSEVEREAVARSREVARLSLQAHICARGHGDIGPALVVGTDDGRGEP